MLGEFHRAFHVFTQREPGTKAVPQDVQDLRFNLHEEELEELADAVAADEIIEIADALGDIIYVAVGTALTYGIEIEPVIAEIHRSNMTKLDKDGTPIFQKDGEVLKGPNFEEPDIAGVLNAQIRREKEIQDAVDELRKRTPNAYEVARLIRQIGTNDG